MPTTRRLAILAILASLPPALVATGFAATSAFAKPFAFARDGAQLRMDRNSLQRERTRYKANEAKLRSDVAAGRMAAVSPDEERVYRDRLAVAAEAKQVRADEALVRKDNAAK